MTNVEQQPLRHKMKPCVVLSFPNFRKHATTGTASAYGFGHVNADTWYSEFLERILDAAANNHHFPVFRMADGEFIFVLGRPYYHRPAKSQWRKWPRWTATTLLASMFPHKGYSSVSHEEYSCKEMIQVRSIFENQLRRLANDGVIAAALDTSPFFEPYVHPFLNWLDAKAINLNESNYIHFYSVYVLLNGPDREKLLRDRHVLVINNLNPIRQESIRTRLLGLGVASVQFLSISRNKAMFEEIDLRQVVEPINVVLVGAGVGSVNILNQLKPLQAACLDVGFSLDILAQPERKWDRPFCVSDDEFDLTRVNFLHNSTRHVHLRRWKN